MKKVLTTIFCTFLLISSFSQTVEKGSVIGQHIGTVALKPDVEYNQWKSFMNSEWLPALNKACQGTCKIYLAEGERGQFKSSISILWVFRSVEARNKYWPEFQKSTEAWNAIFSNLQPLYQELNELGEFKIEASSDWIVL